MCGAFYVYEHWRHDTDKCFYVGKGQKDRAHDMRRGRNRRHKFIQAKLATAGLSVEVRIVESGMEEDAAFAAERKLIAHWRSQGAQLANVTDGGEGSSGRKRTEEELRKVSEKLRGRTLSPEHRAKIALSAIGNRRGLGTKKTPEAIERTVRAHRGVKRSTETCRRISEAKRGVPLGPISAEGRARMSAAQKGRRKSDDHKEKLRLATLAYYARKRAEQHMPLFDRETI